MVQDLIIANYKMMLRFDLKSKLKPKFSLKTKLNLSRPVLTRCS